MKKENENVPLKIENKNNKLFCYSVVELSFAKPKGTITEADFHKIYVTNHNGENIFFKLVDFLRIKFKDVTSVITLPAENLSSFEWKQNWLEKHPQTSDDTEMGVYFFQRLQ